MQLNLENFNVRRSNPYIAGPIGLSPGEERYTAKAQGLVGFEIFKDDKISIRGMGTWDYKSLTSNLARKIKDLDKRNKKGDHSGIGKNQLGVLVAMWEALSDYEENN